MTHEIEPGDTVDILMNLSGLKKYIRGVVLQISEKSVSVMTEFQDELVFRVPKLTVRIADRLYEIKGVSDVPLSLRTMNKGSNNEVE